jgi:hypothetical protein
VKSGDDTSMLDSRVSTRFWEKRTGVSLGRGLVGGFCVRGRGEVPLPNVGRHGWGFGCRVAHFERWGGCQWLVKVLLSGTSWSMMFHDNLKG